MKKKVAALMILTACICLSARSALATGTAAGTEITNRATVNYTVGTASFSKETDQTTLRVAELIDVTATWQDATVTVSPGQTNAALTYKVTNTGNGTEAFTLSVNTAITGDGFDPTFVSIYLDKTTGGTVGSYDAGDTLYLSGTNDPDLAADGSVTVFVLCNIPGDATNGQIGNVKLTATSKTSNASVAQGTVYAGAGDSGVDAVIGTSGGRGEATGGYSANVNQYPLTVTKTGAGAITSSPSGISCGSGCGTTSSNYDINTVVTLTATPDSGATFTGWSGDCSGSATTCEVTMSAARNVTAAFSNNVPVGAITVNSNAEWTNTTAVTLNLSATDDVGITGYYVSESSTAPAITDSGWQTVTSATPYTADTPFTLSGGDGTKTVYAWYRDVTGNISASANDPIKLDSTAPATTANPPGGTYESAQNVALNCGDGSGIGCDKTYYTTDGSNPTASSTQYSGAIPISAPTTLKFISVDKLGNTESVKTETYTIRYPLTASKAGNGSGTITSSPAGVSCGSDCQETYDYNTPVTLTAPADGGSTFAGWSGACSGSETTCTVVMSAARNVTATFNASAGSGSPPPAVVYPLTVTKTGSGTVASSPGGISCGSGCGTTSANYDSGATVTLTAAADTNWAFSGWSGDCSGSATTCTVVMSAARNVTAAFSNNVPVGAITINSNAEWTNTTAVTLNLSATDDVGITGYYVSESSTAPAITDSGWQTVTSATPYTADTPFTLSSGDGTKTVYAWYRDLAGNISAVAADSINLDTTPPTTTANPPGGTYESAQNVTLSCDDGSGIGCDKTYYTVDGTEPTASSSVYSASINIFVDTTLKFFSVDKLGNTESAKTEIYTFPPPSVSIDAKFFDDTALPFKYPFGSSAKKEYIPGSYHIVTFAFTNNRTDPIKVEEVPFTLPKDTMFCIDKNAGAFVNGVKINSPEGNSIKLGSVTFSYDNGSTYDIAGPTITTPPIEGDPSGSGCDENITNLKASLTGELNGNSYFTLKFYGKIR